MKEEKKRERGFELRSEKVRNIVGQIPSALIRYGISAIAIALVALFGIAYFLPFKQVYSGNATIYDIPCAPDSLDNIATTVLLKFENKRPSPHNVSGSPIILQSSIEPINGILISLSSRRDTIGRQEALCQIPKKIAKELENSEVSFILTLHAGTLFDRLFLPIHR